jgi:membrane protein
MHWDLKRHWNESLAFYNKLDQDRVFDNASLLTYQFLLSIIPVLALFYCIFAWLGGFGSLQNELQTYAVDYFTPALSRQINEYLVTIQTRISPSAIGFFGILGFLWTSVSVVSRAETALDQIFGVRISRPFLRQLALYSAVIFLSPLVLVGSVAITSYLAHLLKFNSVLSMAFIILMSLSPLFISVGFTSLIYFLLPHKNVAGVSAIKAGFLTGLTTEVLKQIYTFYASYQLGRSVYGSLAALPVLILWLWLASLIFLLGAELCAHFERGRVRSGEEENNKSSSSKNALLENPSF